MHTLSFDKIRFEIKKINKKSEILKIMTFVDAKLNLIKGVANFRLATLASSPLSE